MRQLFFFFFFFFFFLSTSPFLSSSLDFHHVNLHDLSFKSSHHPKDHHHQNHTHVDKLHTEDNLSVNLFHRDSLSNHAYRSHGHRIASLLARDAARAAAVTRRLSPSYKVEDFGSEVVSGLTAGSGEYFVRVGVGTPPEDQFMVVDSGSDVIWVQCEPCERCYSQSDPVFDPAESASFAGVPCDSELCGLLMSSAVSDGRCHGGGCRYEVSYGDGSYTDGVLALETLTFDGAVVSGVAIGCGHRNRGLFVGAAGLLGLGWGPMSLVGQLGGSAGSAFGYCLVSRAGGSATGSLVFGRSAAVPVGAVWVPLLRNPRAPSFYYVGLMGLGIGGVRLPLLEDLFQLDGDGGGGVVMDTGTAVTRLPDSAYAALRDAFVGATSELPRSPQVSIFDTCYDLGGFESVRVPTVSFYFSEGAILTLPARNYMIPVDDSGTYCFAFAPASSGLSIMGNIQQEGIQITFDAANGFVGFGPNTC
ncbi:protein ASPARTIC PROTEASE IN GUARD CELL 2 [Typha angustifolia]|uniref:protein ASPARTIC PROTEASE IN GUARD CELL 2 n=1 Tax=Typha angustifolia TaxID=59011 RepID=UPI003C2C4CE2